MAEVLGEKGNVIMLRYRTGSESTEQREKGILAEIANYPNIKVLSSDQHGGDSAQLAKEKMSQLLIKHRDEVNGVFAVCESNCIGVLEALEQADLAGKVKFVAFDSDDRLIRGMEAGTVDGIVLQDPVMMGYMAVKLAVQSIRDPDAKADSFVSTGEYIATPENKDTDEMKRLLMPEKFGE